MTRGQTSEIMANYFALTGSKDPRVKAAERIVRALLPDTMKAMDELVERIAKYDPATDA
jgi:hypothetical protein